MDLPGEVMKAAVEVRHLGARRQVDRPGDFLDGSPEFPSLLGSRVQEPLLRPGELARSVEFHQRAVEDVVPDVHDLARAERLSLGVACRSFTSATNRS